MAKKKPKNKRKEEPFDYEEYIEKTFTNPKAFLYYIKVNNITFKNKEEVNDIYNKFKILGGY